MAQAATTLAQEARHGPPDMTAPLRARILIVDDDERNAFAAVEALQELGHELVVARSGDDALRRLLEDEYAVILLDLHMPGMDGYETAALIRQRKRTASTPIVFLTAIFRDEAHVFQAYSAGAVDVVFKPVDPFILRSKVAVLVDLHLKTLEIKREAAHRQWLLDEHARVKSEKAVAERRLKRAEARQAAIMRSVPLVFHARVAEPPFATLFVSDAVAAITGFPPERFTEEPEFGSSRIHPDDLDKVVAAVSGAVTTGAYTCEFRWLCADGQYRYLQDQGVLAPASDGDGREIFGVILDSTDRRQLEEQLAQARKMEAVGQLTGGVAHDFNNLLTVVLGNIDMLGRKAEDDARRARRIDAVRQAAERGRDLTRHLLAFSRRQHLNPSTVDVNALIRDFAPLMRQAVGEGVTLDLALADEALWTHVDPTHLETALLNLAVNARDAMEGGGRLEIRTERAESGDWVSIAVTDTGSGMAPEVSERIFEPFFTTKEVGRGSGLGLSQVYGFVNQSEGRVTVRSVLGEGSTFRLLLPPTAPGVVDVRDERPSAEIVGGSEHILVVEDDASVLALTADLLAGLGYRVSTAPDAAQALDILETDPDIELLFTDVVMPGGTNGVGLARQAQAARPDLKILLTSGFVGDRAALGAGEFPLLDKPYETPALAARLRALLDGKASRRRRAKAARNDSVAATAP